MFDLFRGKKTLIVSIVGLGLGIASGFGVAIPAFIWPILGGLGLGSARLGMAKAEKATLAVKEALDEVKK